MTAVMDQEAPPSAEAERDELLRSVTDLSTAHKAMLDTVSKAAVHRFETSDGAICSGGFAGFMRDCSLGWDEDRRIPRENTAEVIEHPEFYSAIGLAAMRDTLEAKYAAHRARIAERILKAVRDGYVSASIASRVMKGVGLGGIEKRSTMGLTIQVSLPITKAAAADTAVGALRARLAEALSAALVPFTTAQQEQILSQFTNSYESISIGSSARYELIDPAETAPAADGSEQLAQAG